MRGGGLGRIDARLFRQHHLVVAALVALVRACVARLRALGALLGDACACRRFCRRDLGIVGRHVLTLADRRVVGTRKFPSRRLGVDKSGSAILIAARTRLSQGSRCDAGAAPQL